MKRKKKKEERQTENQTLNYREQTVARGEVGGRTGETGEGG